MSKSNKLLKNSKISKPNKLSKISKSNKLSKIESINKNKATVAAKISNMIDYGRIEITTSPQIFGQVKKQLELFPIGSLVSYMNSQNIFRSGGFIVKFADDYFIYVNQTFTTKFRVRYKNVLKIWVGDVFKVKGDTISLAKPPSNKKTNFEAIVGNHIVFYAKDNFALKRFINTNKFKNMVKWHNYFKNDTEETH